MDLFLNELSIEHSHKEIAKEKFILFCNTWIAAKKLGFKFIKTTSDFQAKPFAPNFFFRKLIEEIDADLRTLMLDNLLTTPYIDELINFKSIENNITFSFYYKENECFGLGAASDFLLDTASISFLSSTDWNTPKITISANYLTETELEEKIIDVKNIASEEHIKLHSAFFKNKVKFSISSGRELFLKKEQLFPKLVFVGNTKKQINDLSIKHPNYNQVVEILFLLQEYFSNWNGNFDERKIVSRFEIAAFENEETLKHYSAERTFNLNSQRKEIFQAHVKMKLNQWRIHFFPDTESLKCYIGYIGEHLRVPTFKH